MTTKTTIRMLGALVLLGALSAHADLTVKGSDTMVILGQKWAEEFMKKNPGKKLQVTGGGSGTGLAALLNGTTEIAMSSRPMKDAEQEKLRARYNAPPSEFAVARDGVAFYVNEKNPVSALTEEQLRGIYLGDITNWKELGGPDKKIVVYSRENSSGTYVFVKDNLLNGDDFTPAAQTLPGTAAVVNSVAKEQWGIGYGGAAYGIGIKELKLKTPKGDIPPSQEAVKSGAYPLSRDLYFYVRGAPKAEAKAFIDFVLSSDGQKLVSQVGYFPVK